MNTLMNSKVLIITINYNQAQMTIECVDSILQSTYDNFQVYLIDNGSKEDDYYRLVSACGQNPKVIILRIEQNSGYVGGVNHGLKNASKQNPDYILIMNNDTIIDREAISELVISANRNSNKAIIAGIVLDFKFPERIQTTGSMFLDTRYLKETYPYRGKALTSSILKEEPRDMLDDIMWLIPKEVFQVVGFYPDCYFLYAEQADYALKARKNGFGLIFTPNAKIWHKGSITTGDGNRYAPPVNFWRNKSSTIYLFRNIKFRYFIIYTLKRLFKLSVKILKNFFDKNSINKKSEYAALMGVIYGIYWVFHQRPDNGFNPFISKLK